MARTLVLLLVSATLLRAQGYMTQIVDGGGWNTTITVVNTSDFAEQVTVSFFDDGGNALTLGIVDQGSYSGAQVPVPNGNPEQPLPRRTACIVVEHRRPLVESARVATSPGSGTVRNPGDGRTRGRACSGTFQRR